MKPRIIGIIFVTGRKGNINRTWKNPRGYFNSEIDTLTNTGKDQFQNVALKFTERCLIQLDYINMLGEEKGFGKIVNHVLVWDLDGSYPEKSQRKKWTHDIDYTKFRIKLEQEKTALSSWWVQRIINTSAIQELIEQHTSYVEQQQYYTKGYELGFVGDPVRLPPEWTYKNTAKEFFNRFIDEGYKTGVTIRDKWAIGSPATEEFFWMNRPEQQVSSQKDVEAKIQNTYNSLNTSFYYFDDFNIKSNIHNNIAQKNPTTLFIVELEKERKFANIIPYQKVPTDTSILNMYPNTHGFYDVSTDPFSDETVKERIKRAWENNDYVGINCWFNSREIKLITEILNNE